MLVQENRWGGRVGGGGHTVLFLSLCGISKARLLSHISQSDVTCFPLAAIPNFPEAEVHDFTYWRGVGQNLTLKVGEIPFKLDVQIRARSLPNSKLPSNHWYYKQVIPPFGRRRGLKRWKPDIRGLWGLSWSRQICHDDSKAQVGLVFSANTWLTQNAATFVQIFLGKSPLVIGRCLSYYIAVFLQQEEWFLNRT